MITRPEVDAINAFDPMEWLKIHKIWHPDLDFTNMFPRSRESEVNHFITQCNLNEYFVEPNSMYYLAGPYNDYVNDEGDTFDIDDNIDFARSANFRLWYLGLSVFCPHMNTRDFHRPHRMFDKVVKISDVVFTKGLLDNQHRFSGLILLPNWMYSNGTKAEIKKALEIGQPIFLYDEVIDRIWEPLNFKETLRDIREEMVREQHVLGQG